MKNCKRCKTIRTSHRSRLCSVCRKERFNYNLLSTLWGLLVIIPSMLILTGGLVLIHMWLWYSVILGVACIFGSLAWFAIVAVIGDEKIGEHE